MIIPKKLSLIFLIISFLFIIKNIYDLIIENYINLYEKISNISIFLLIIIVFYFIFSFSEKTINYSKVGIFIKKYFPYLILSKYLFFKTLIYLSLPLSCNYVMKRLCQLF